MRARFAREFYTEPVHEHVDDGNNIKRDQGRNHQAAHDHDAHWVARLGPRPLRKGDRDGA